MSQQNFENHAKFVPVFHFVVAPIFLINLIWAVRDVIVRFSAQSVRGLLVAFALLAGCFLARTFALTVQDRVIRLEMRLRLQELLPPDLRARIQEFTLAQLVSLRFAGDAELPALARKVLDEKIADRKVIKRLVQNWQPDFLRA